MNSLEKLRAAMREKNIPAVLVTDPLNQRYLTNFSFEDGYVLVLMDKSYLITDFRYTEAAEKAVSSDITVVAPNGMLTFIEETLKESGVSALGYEDFSLSGFRIEKFRSFFSALLVPVGNLFLGIRLIKSEEECEKIQKAQDITDRAFTYILENLREDMTETDVALALEFFMRREGAERVSFDIIAVSGKQSALPHGVPRRKKLERGFLTMDFGCIVEGYCSDMTRTVVIGKADAEMRCLYNTVLTAQTEAIAAIAGGASCHAVDAVARNIIENAGYHGAFGHSLGHGVGMYIHENPRLSPAAAKEELLIPGEVVTAEPGIYLPGQYGCRIEDMLLVTENGYRNFTHSKKDLIELF